MFSGGSRSLPSLPARTPADSAAISSRGPEGVRAKASTRSIWPPTGMPSISQTKCQSTASFTRSAFGVPVFFSARSRISRLMSVSTLNRFRFCVLIFMIALTVALARSRSFSVARIDCMWTR